MKYLLSLFLLFAGTALAAEPAPWDLTVDGLARSALVYAPESAKSTPAPLVFVFHGHGGNSRNALRQFPIPTLWPEAIVVAMQGLPTPGRLSDPDGKRPGWQHAAGDQGDRDLNFFDAMLERLKKDYTIDPRRVYATGHSNGGAFTYLLWAERGALFAATAPSGSPATRSAAKLKPKPLLHVAGKADPLVKFAWQETTINLVRKLNDCAAEGKPWAANATLYPSAGGTPVVTYIHEGGHEFPAAASPLIVRFFKEHSLPAK